MHIDARNIVEYVRSSALQVLSLPREELNADNITTALNSAFYKAVNRFVMRCLPDIVDETASLVGKRMVRPYPRNLWGIPIEIQWLPMKRDNPNGLYPFYIINEPLQLTVLSYLEQFYILSRLSMPDKYARYLPHVACVVPAHYRKNTGIREWDEAVSLLEHIEKLNAVFDMSSLLLADMWQTATGSMEEPPRHPEVEHMVRYFIENTAFDRNNNLLLGYYTVKDLVLLAVKAHAHARLSPNEVISGHTLYVPAHLVPSYKKHIESLRALTGVIDLSVKGSRVPDTPSQLFDILHMFGPEMCSVACMLSATTLSKWGISIKPPVSNDMFVSYDYFARKLHGVFYKPESISCYNNLSIRKNRSCSFSEQLRIRKHSNRLYKKH